MAASFTPREVPILSRSKKNTTGSTIAKGSAVKLSSSADDEIALCAADTDVLYGVARADIADKDYGDIGVIGTFACLAGGTVTRGQRVGPDGTGKFVAATVDKKTVAGLAERSAASSELFEVTLGVGTTTSV